mgnify:FL=1
MMRIGGILAISIIIASMCGALYVYTENSYTNVLISDLGEQVIIGNVVFDVQHVANYDILEKTKEYEEFEKTQVRAGLIEASRETPEGVYFQIQITAENKGDEDITLTGGQFHLYDEENTRYDPTFIGYGENELSTIELEPNKPITITTQFDISFDEEIQYKVGIVPNRYGLEGSWEIAFICVMNCE